MAFPKVRTSRAPRNQQDLMVTLVTGLMIVGTGKTLVGTLCGVVTHLLHGNRNSERVRIGNHCEAREDGDDQHPDSEEHLLLHLE